MRQPPSVWDGVGGCRRLRPSGPSHRAVGDLMGIRFICPNGHKLHVKAFQAGRRGICPHCGAGVAIPTESTRPSSKRRGSKGLKRRRPEPGSPTLPSAAVPASQQPPADLAPASGTAFAPVSLEDPAEAFVPLAPDGSGSSGAPSGWPAGIGGLSGSHADRGESAPSDPLAEAPDAVWYVRPTLGGQFGPASRATMSAWLAEGRVSADALVWREGWRDWREAGAVFPHLGGTDYVPGLQELLPAEPLEYHPMTAAYSKSGREKSGARFGLILAIAVPIALLLLAAILWWLQSG